MHLNGVRSQPANLLKLPGHIGATAAEFMLDSGASSDFIDAAFAERCGLALTPSHRTIRLADGSETPALGEVRVTYSLTDRTGTAVPYSTLFTATPLHGYDAILGLSWLTHHDVAVGYKDRSIAVRTTGRQQHHYRPTTVGVAVDTEHLSVLRLSGLSRALRRNQVLDIHAVFVKTEGAPAPEQNKEHPEMQALLREYADVFPDQLPPGVPPERGGLHRIVLKDGATMPPVRPLHHQSSKDLAVFEEYTRTMIASGQLRPSTSPYGAMALIVRKKDGTARVVVDYRGLNEITVKNKYPLPLMDELFDRVHGAQFYSKLDLRTGFHQIAIHEDDVAKTAFRTRYGSFEFLVLPMGLCNAPGTFMQLMNDTFRDLLDKSVLVFLDDILVFSDTLDDHVRHVREVLDRLRAAKLYAKLSKCEFFQQEVEFLGHHIGANGLSVMQDKVQAVREWPTPRNVHDVRSFLGLAGFYRRFVRNFSAVALPITELTKTVTGTGFAWGPEQEKAFSALKDALCQAPVLLIADPALPFTLNCDACGYAIGATLQQDQGNGLQPVAYMSRKLTPAEMNYDTREKEFLALVDACRHWRHYLHSATPFHLLTDHDSLKYHKTMPNISGRIARWIERMAEFEYDIAHIAGVKNVVADALSRRSDLKDLTLGATVMRKRGIPVGIYEAAERIANREAAELVQEVAPGAPAANAAGVIRMPSQMCTAQTRLDRQCRARTAMGQYCWQHLRSIRGLRIRMSAIPGAGRGLHAARDLPAGYRIDYTGDRVPTGDQQNGGPYYLELSRTTSIDAARTNCGEGRWLNDPRGTALKSNCSFSVYTPPGRPRIGCVRTSRPIKKGEELLIRYGSDYWNYYGASGVARRAAQQAKRRRAAPAADVLASLDDAGDSDTTLDEDIVAAACKDTAYQVRLATPGDLTVHNDLLWTAVGVQLLVPDDLALRTRILSECHDSVTGAHFGRDKTLAAVQQRFVWRGLDTDVGNYVATCDLCQRNKPSQQLTPGALMPLAPPDYPGQHWTQDAVTGLPTTKKGFDAIQVYVDRLTKVKHFAATRKSDGAKELASSLLHTVIRVHGVPESIVSDRDPRFTANYYAELSKLVGTKLSMSTARHPQSDGQSEREIKTLIIALRAYCNDHQDDWDQYLDLLELGFNCAVQSSTKVAPYMLLYGRQPRLPIDVALSSLAPRNPAAVDRVTRMREALKFARDHIDRAQAAQIRNAARRTDAFAVGDQVLLLTEGLTLRGLTNKLCPRFVGPFTVTDVVNSNAYTLALPKQLQALHPTFNIDKLRRYRDGSAAFPGRPALFARPPPVADADSNGDAVWLVERITAQKYTGRRIRYLVHWEGYPIEESSWQTRADLAGAEDKIAEWNALVPA